MTDRYNHFIGNTFTTPTGSTLTVVGWDGVSKRQKARLYDVSCSVCSSDTELFPSPFKVTSDRLKRGTCPCECTPNTKWTESQYVVRVTRECNLRGYVFNGWASEFKGKLTKLDITNPRNGNNWKSSIINNFMGGAGCPVEGGVLSTNASRLPDQYHIKQFLSTGSFVSGTSFTKDLITRDKNGKFCYWDVECPTCKEDSFHGLSGHVFKASTSHLKEGKLPCRCAHGYPLNRKERELQIKSICKEKNRKFICWKDSSEDVYSEFYWECHHGHTCCSSVNTFVNAKAGCNTCRFNRWGLYLHRLEEDDNLYIIRFTNGDEVFIKIGRAFDVGVRCKEYISAGYNVEVLHTVKANHNTVFHLEKECHRYYDDYLYKPLIHFDGAARECFTVDMYNPNSTMDTIKQIKADLILPEHKKTS